MKPSTGELAGAGTALIEKLGAGAGLGAGGGEAAAGEQRGAVGEDARTGRARREGEQPAVEEPVAMQSSATALVP